MTGSGHGGMLSAGLAGATPFICQGGRVGYSVGIDLGTTFTAAAIDRTGRIEIATLGDRTAAIPSVVLFRADGPALTGDAANRRATTEPDRVAREFKRRFGDPTPLVLGGAPHSVSSILARLLTAVVGTIADREGGPAERVVLTHPANWGPYKRELFASVPRLAEIDRVAMITEPEAAAVHYAASERLADGAVIAVYDFGGGTFDATVLRKHEAGFDILGTPEGVEGLGGMDFDEAVFAFVDRTLDGAVTASALSDRRGAAALLRLRQECVLAKEALSVDTETTIPVLLPALQTEVRLTRTELEEMMRPSIELTVGSLARALRSASVAAEDLTAVLLVGGSSRIPLVSQMVSAALGRPTVVDTHPKHAIALGAAALAGASRDDAAGPVHAGSPQGTAQPGPAVPPAPREVAPQPVPAGAPGKEQPAVAPVAPSAPVALATPASVPAPRLPSRADGAVPPVDPPSGDAGGAVPPPPLADHGSGEGARRRRRRVLALAGAAVVVVVVVLGGVLLLNRGSTTPRATVPGAPGPTAAGPAAASIDKPAVIATVPVGAHPQAVVIAPDGRTAYVTNSADETMSVLDTAAGSVSGTIPIHAGPPQFAATAPDGKHLYVSVFAPSGSAAGAVGQVAVVDTATRAVTTTIPVGRTPYALAVTPDGSRVYVPNHDSASLSVIDTATGKVSATIPVKPNPHFVAFTKDGSTAFVANHESNLVSVVNTAENVVTATIPVGRSPHSLAVSPDQKRVLVVNYDENDVSVIDVATDKVLSEIPVGTHPQSVAFAPDGRHAYVANNGDNTVSVIDTGMNVAVSTVDVGRSPTTVAVRPDGRAAYVSDFDANTVSVLGIAG